MFGRRAVLPIDVRSAAIEAVDNVFTAVDEEMVKKMAEAQKTTLETAKMNIVTAQDKQKQTYDRKHCTSFEIYSVGSAVLKKDFTRKKRKGGKLDSTWVGPYTISLES